MKFVYKFIRFITFSVWEFYQTMNVMHCHIKLNVPICIGSSANRMKVCHSLAVVVLAAATVVVVLVAVVVVVVVRKRSLSRLVSLGGGYLTLNLLAPTTVGARINP